jgi:hypothetical protein
MTDTVTLYNRFPVREGPEVTARYARTVLTGVMWKESARLGQDPGGRSFLEKTVSVTIPKGARASGGKTYIEPGRFNGLETEGRWTLTLDSANPDIMVRGDCPEEINGGYTLTRLKKDYPAMDIRAAADNTGTDMLPHWAVKGV